MRINFESRVYRNPMYSKLIIHLACEYKAKGMLVTAWELAQDHWLAHRGVPADKWPSDLQPLIDFKFARIETRDSGQFIYVSGSKEECKFLEAKSAAGKKGGASKSPNKTKNLKQNQAKPKQRRNSTEASVNISETKGNHTETSSSNSFSNSDSNSSSKGTAALFDSEYGAVDELAKTKEPLLLSALTVVPKKIQEIWLDRWDSTFVLKTAEKCVLKRIAAGADATEPWSETITAWLFRELPQVLKKGPTKYWTPPIQENHEGETGQEMLARYGAANFLELMSKLKTSAVA
ncbi:hypothetical protein ACES2L_05910 [Bdellovibrio bacteriovorus]